MRNLKRALSLALASVMVISMMVVGAGAASYDEFSDKDEIVNKEAVQMLVELGVINGKDTGDFDPTGIVTRAEMAKMICVVLNGGKDPSLGTTVTNSYADTVGHWASGYIEYCTQLGIVAGDGAGNFNPNATVTGSEAAKMLLVAMGYKSEVEGFTGANWSIAVNVRANQKGLYSDLSISVDAGLTRDDAAQMIYNALDAGVVSYDYTLVTDGSTISSSPTLIDNNNKTLLEDKFNAVKVEGVVVANEFANLSSNSTNSDYAKGVVGSALDEGKTRLNVTNYEDQGYYTNGNTDFAVSTGKDELGRSVVLYVKKNANAAKAEVLGSAITSSDNKVAVDYSSDSVKDVADDNNLTFTSNTKIAYNYASMETLTADPDDIGASGYEKIVIDTDNDGDVDYVLYNNYQLGKVTKYSTSSDGSITVSLKSGSYTVDDKADVVGFDDVAKDDYVLAAFFGGKLYVEKAETITGTLEAYKNNSKGVATKLTVDGTDYNVSTVDTYTANDFFAATTQGQDVLLDTEATFYLDQQGYIVAAGEVAENAYDYAYVMVKGNDNLSDRVKVALSDGTTGTYEVSSKSSVEFSKIQEGALYAYSLTSDKQIKLTKAATDGTADSAKFEKGKSTIELTNPKNVDAKEYANNSTVFFYVDGDDVTVYTGRSSAPSIDSCNGVKLALNKAGTVVAAVFNGVKGTPTVGDHLFVYSLGKTYSDYREANVVLNGKDETETIKVDNGSTLAADTLYTYSVNADGYYELTAVTGKDYYVSGTVDHIYSTSIVIDGAEYVTTDKTVVVDNDGDPSTPDVALNGNVNEGSEVQVLLDDDEIVMLVIDKDSNTNNGGSGSHDEYAPTVALAADNKLNIEYYHGDNEPTSDEVKEMILAQIDGAETVAYRGGQYVVTYDDGTQDKLTPVATPLYRITYNDKDYFLADTKTLDVNTGATVLSVATAENGAVTYTKENTPSDKYTVNKDNKDVVLVDGYKVTDSTSGGIKSISYETAKGAAITPADDSGKYIAAGDVVVVEAAENKTITATATDKNNTVLLTTSDKGEFTMPESEVVLTAKTTVTVTLKGVTEGVFTATNGSDKFSVIIDKTSAQAGDTVKVTVENLTDMSATVTVKLTATNGSTISPNSTTGIEYAAGTLAGQVRVFNVTLADNATETLTVSHS